MGIIRGQKPDLTPAQLVSGIPIVLKLLAAFGVYKVTGEQSEVLQDLGTWALGLLGADAIIRVGRNYANAVTQAAALSGSQPLQPIVGTVQFTGDPDVSGGGSLPTDDDELGSPPPDASNMPDQVVGGTFGQAASTSTSRVSGAGAVAPGDEYPPLRP